MVNNHICSEPTFVFGPFEFHPTRRLLTREHQPLRIGSRAHELLLTLLESAGTLVEKKAIIRRVWPSTIVEEGTLRVHIAGLRKLLGNWQNRQPYIENIHGLGYRFAAPVIRQEPFRIWGEYVPALVPLVVRTNEISTGDNGFR
jgi:DNA-binding winged helix-turn-helix (wHTH) protein